MIFRWVGDGDEGPLWVVARRPKTDINKLVLPLSNSDDSYLVGTRTDSSPRHPRLTRATIPVSACLREAAGVRRDPTALRRRLLGSDRSTFKKVVVDELVSFFTVGNLPATKPLAGNRLGNTLAAGLRRPLAGRLPTPISY